MSSIKTVLVTGLNGFVGNHLTRELINNGIEVVGVGGPNSPDPIVSIASYKNLDLNAESAADTIDFSKIDGVVHLAGLAEVGASFDRPLEYIQTNMGMEINLFNAALKQSAFPRILIISSGNLYDPHAKLPLTEESRVKPSSPYAVSKLGQEQLAEYYATRGFDTMIARPFNHIGPGQRPGFLVPDLINQIVKIENGKMQHISVGNLDAARDYTDVRDIVKAYVQILKYGDPGEIYNVCSGKPITGSEMLEKILAIAKREVEVKADPSKLRPSDAPVIFGSHKKLTSQTGWKPTINLETTLADTLEYYRK